MKFLLVCLLIVFVSAQYVQGDIVCNLCKDFINLVKDLLTIDGANAVRQYIDETCAKASGFLHTLCLKVLDFGVDELVKLIENNVDAQTICASISAC